MAHALPLFCYLCHLCYLCCLSARALRCLARREPCLWSVSVRRVVLAVRSTHAWMTDVVPTPVHCARLCLYLTGMQRERVLSLSNGSTLPVESNEDYEEYGAGANPTSRSHIQSAI